MSLQIIDFHNHYVGPGIEITTLRGLSAATRERWQAINRKLADPQALLSSIDAAGITARVINTPPAFLEDADGKVDLDTIRRINDGLAELVTRNNGRLYALATVDAYAGDHGAREVERAVRELGFRGIFVESANKGLLLDSPSARPTLFAAANLRVPVFVHPVNDASLMDRFGSYGRTGTLLARGTINAGALTALLEGGVFGDLPNLRVVVTTLALGGAFIAAAFGGGDAQETLRRSVYVDTMALHPVLVRAAVDLLGADHVLLGTDWPVFVEESVPERLQKVLEHAGVGPHEQELIASGNTKRILALS